MDSLAIDWRGEYASYDRPEDWLPKLEERKVSPWILGQMILANHNEGRFRTHVAEETVLAGSSVRLRVEGVTPLAPLAILSGRLSGGPLDLFGKVIIPYQENLTPWSRFLPTRREERTSSSLSSGSRADNRPTRQAP